MGTVAQGAFAQMKGEGQGGGRKKSPEGQEGAADGAREPMRVLDVLA